MEALNSGADFSLQKGGSPKAQFTELANMFGRAVVKRWMEQSLRKKEPCFREILENISLKAVQLDRSGLVTFAHRSLQMQGNWKKEELLGINWFLRLIPEEDRETAHQVINVMLAPPES